MEKNMEAKAKGLEGKESHYTRIFSQRQIITP
jgi:hypothetical protein